MKDFDVKSAMEETIKKIRSSPSQSERMPVSNQRQAPFYDVEGLTNPSQYITPTHFLAHLERLPGVVIGRIKSSLLYDDFRADFIYQGYSFVIKMMWGGDMSLVSDKTVPLETFDAVLEHLRHYRRISFGAVMWASIKYALKRS